MNRDGLNTLLESMGYPPAFVGAGPAEDRWSVLRRPDGRWAAFSTERGGRFDEADFTDEESACFFVLGRLAFPFLGAI